MAAKTKTSALEAVDAQLVSADELRRHLEEELAEVEGRIAAGFGAPAPDLEQQHASLTARLKSLPILQRRLTQDKEQAEAAETLKLFEGYTREMFEAYSTVAELDDKIKALLEQVGALTKKRSDVLGMIQIPQGRRSRLNDAIRRYNLGQAVAEIRKKYTVGIYM